MWETKINPFEASSGGVVWTYPKEGSEWREPPRNPPVLKITPSLADSDNTPGLRVFATPSVAGHCDLKEGGRRVIGTGFGNCWYTALGNSPIEVGEKIRLKLKKHGMVASVGVARPDVDQTKWLGNIAGGWGLRSIGTLYANDEEKKLKGRALPKFGQGHVLRLERLSQKRFRRVASNSSIGREHGWTSEL